MHQVVEVHEVEISRTIGARWWLSAFVGLGVLLWVTSLDSDPWRVRDCATEDTCSFAVNDIADNGLGLTGQDDRPSGEILFGTSIRALAADTTSRGSIALSLVSEEIEVTTSAPDGPHLSPAFGEGPNDDASSFNATGHASHFASSSQPTGAADPTPSAAEIFLAIAQAASGMSTEFAAAANSTQPAPVDNAATVIALGPENVSDGISNDGSTVDNAIAMARIAIQHESAKPSTGIQSVDSARLDSGPTNSSSGAGGSHPPTTGAGGTGTDPVVFGTPSALSGGTPEGPPGGGNPQFPPITIPPSTGSPGNPGHWNPPPGTSGSPPAPVPGGLADPGPTFGSSPTQHSPPPPQSGLVPSPPPRGLYQWIDDPLLQSGPTSTAPVVTKVPEPPSGWLFVVGLAAMAGFGAFRRKRG